MKLCIVLLAFSVLSATAQVGAIAQHRPAEMLDGPALEAAQKANPDDTGNTAQLFHFYQQESRDPTWTGRFALLSWNIQHHPEAAFLGSTATYLNMPPTLRDQVKQLWVIQVHEHADEPRVLRNAAAGIDTQLPSIRVGGNVQQANILTQIAPDYPPMARESGIQGTVRFEATIGLDGHVQNLQLVFGNPLLVAPAMKAVNQWTYKPTLLNGNPVRVVTTIDVNFTLQP